MNERYHTQRMLYVERRGLHCYAGQDGFRELRTRKQPFRVWTARTSPDRRSREKREDAFVRRCREVIIKTNPARDADVEAIAKVAQRERPLCPLVDERLLGSRTERNRIKASRDVVTRSGLRMQRRRRCRCEPHCTVPFAAAAL